MSNESDTFGYDKLSAFELRKIISDLYGDNLDMSEQKKAYVDGINEVIKNNKERMDVAISFLRAAVKAGQDQEHERAVDKFLSERQPSTN